MPATKPWSVSPSFSILSTNSSNLWPVTIADNQTVSSPSNGIVPVYTTNDYDVDLSTVEDSDTEETKSDASQSIDEYRGKRFKLHGNVELGYSL